jgi:hypothetical protein
MQFCNTVLPKDPLYDLNAFHHTVKSVIHHSTYCSIQIYSCEKAISKKVAQFAFMAALYLKRLICNKLWRLYIQVPLLIVIQVLSELVNLLLLFDPSLVLFSSYPILSGAVQMMFLSGYIQFGSVEVLFATAKMLVCCLTMLSGSPQMVKLSIEMINVRCRSERKRLTLAFAWC